MPQPADSAGHHEVLCFEHEGRRWVRITVEDRGNGIPREYGEKIFEPFFSSKPKELGTGLGLSISFGIVQDHHGNIRYETAEGLYTKFIVELPVDNGWLLNGPSDTDKEVIS
jgi:signal transduction histidine kinase